MTRSRKPPAKPQSDSKPKAKFGKVEQAVEGQAHKYHTRKNGTTVVYTVCCDCGLVHLEEFVQKPKYLRVRVWRDDQRTQAIRKQRRGNRSK
jgi:hypothetical protein